MIHLDTHAVVWLHAGEIERFSPTVRHELERQPLAISPMVELELAFLLESKRVRFGPSEIVGALHADLGLVIANDPWPAVVHRATTLTWTRDPFDRLIAAHALVTGARLITKDEHLRRHLGAIACW